MFLRFEYGKETYIVADVHFPTPWRTIKELQDALEDMMRGLEKLTKDHDDATIIVAGDSNAGANIMETLVGGQDIGLGNCVAANASRATHKGALLGGSPRQRT